MLVKRFLVARSFEHQEYNHSNLRIEKILGDKNHLETVFLKVKQNKKIYKPNDINKEIVKLKTISTSTYVLFSVEEIDKLRLQLIRLSSEYNKINLKFIKNLNASIENGKQVINY